MATTDGLPFLPGYWLVRDGDFVALESAYGALQLDKTNRPFYELGEVGALLLTPDTICAYVRFFYDNVVATKMPGQFIVVEPGDEFPWLAGIDDSVKANILALVKPMRYVGVDAQGLHTVQMTIVFKTAMFRVDAKVSTDHRSVFAQTREQADPQEFHQQHFTPGAMALWNETILAEAVPVIEELWKRGVLP